MGNTFQDPETTESTERYIDVCVCVCVFPPPPPYIHL